MSIAKCLFLTTFSYPGNIFPGWRYPPREKTTAKIFLKLEYDTLTTTEIYLNLFQRTSSGSFPIKGAKQWTKKRKGKN